MPADELPHILDNVSWNALNTYESHFAISNGLAKRYLPDVAPFAALAEPTEAAFDDLAAIVPKGDVVDIAFWKTVPQLPAGWTVVHTLTLNQMVSGGALPEIMSTEAIIRLTVSDVPDMMRLVNLSEPGPFRERAIEFGHYIGIRQHGELIAMAGERRHLTGYYELSAICTHPDHRGKGYARLLTSQLVNENWQRGEVPFLHVKTENTPAFQLYQKLNFHTRGEAHVLILTR